MDGVAVPVAAASVVLLIIVSALAMRRSRSDRQAAPSTPAERAELSKARRDTWRRGLSVAALGAGCLMLFAIAGTAGWLSFAAQRGYAHSRNGGDWDAATGFALLLDAGTLGLSLFRFFEALTLRSSALTRLLLVAFVGASAQMNYLHAPPGEGGVVDFGSRFVAVIPPLVYAVLLEMLLFKVEQVIMGKRPKRRKERERGYSLLLWVPFVGYPRRMWRAWRSDLLQTLDNVRAPGSLKPLPAVAHPPKASGAAVEPMKAQSGPSLPGPRRETSPRPEQDHTLPVEGSGAPTLRAPAAEQSAPAQCVEPSPARREAPLHPQNTAEAGQPPASPKPPSLKQQLFEGLVHEMRSGIWDAVSEDAVTRTAAWVRVNKRLGQERGEETLLAYNSARNAFRTFATELQTAAEKIRQEQRASTVHERPVEEPTRAPQSSAAALPELDTTRDGDRESVGV